MAQQNPNLLDMLNAVSAGDPLAGTVPPTLAPAAQPPQSESVQTPASAPPPAPAQPPQSTSNDNTPGPSSIALPAPASDNESTPAAEKPPSFLRKLAQFAAGAAGEPNLANPNATPGQKGAAVSGLLGRLGSGLAMAAGTPEQKQIGAEQSQVPLKLAQLQNEQQYRNALVANNANKTAIASKTEADKYDLGDQLLGLPPGTSRLSAEAAAQRAGTAAQVGGAKTGNLQADTEKKNIEIENMRNGQYPVDFATANAVGRPDLAGKPVSEQLWKGFQSVLNAKGYKSVDLGMGQPGQPQSGGLWLLDREGNKVHQISEVSPSAARGEAYGAFRPVQAIDANGNARYMTAGQAEATGAAPAGLGSQVMSKQAQFKDIYSGIGNMRAAMAGIAKQPLDALTVAKLTMATRETDPTVAKQVMDTIATQNLSPEQQDFVVALGQLNERALSLRNLAGMGNGSDQVRAAIRATLPGAKSGNIDMMRKQLDSVQNLVDNLHTGVPNISAVKQQSAANPPQNTPKEGATATGPGNHKIQFTKGKWVDAATKQPI